MSNHPSTVDALAHQAKIIAFGAVAAVALALAFAAAPAPAFAVDAAGAYDQGSPCVPTEEQIEAYVLTARLTSACRPPSALATSSRPSA